MKVNNKGGKGNPYHNNDNGQFSSPNNDSFGSIEELESFVFGDEENDDIFSEIELADLDDFWNDLDLDDSDLDDLDNLDLDGIDDLNLDNLDSDNLDSDKIEIPDVIKNSTYYQESLNFIKNSLSDEEIIETISMLNQELDMVKISQLSIDEQRELLIALKITNNFKELDSYKAIQNLKNKSFYNLWVTPVTVLDYEEKKDKIINKKKYFELDYQGLDKEEKLKLLQEFEEYGKQYTELNQKFEEQLSYFRNLVEKFENPNSIYSQKRKDEAIWIKDFGFNSVKESIKVFGPTAQNVINKLNNENEKFIESVKDYTNSYSFINEPLRNKMYFGPKSKQTSFVKEVENITYAIDNSTYDKDIWLQRGTSEINIGNGFSINSYSTIEQLESLIGKTFVDQGFVSCGAAKSTGFTDKDVIMNVYCPKGTKMLYVEPISHFHGENEMIIQRGYSYKITKVEKKNGRIFLDVDVILGSDKNKYDTKKLKELQKNNFN